MWCGVNLVLFKMDVLQEQGGEGKNHDCCVTYLCMTYCCCTLFNQNFIIKGKHTQTLKFLETWLSFYVLKNRKCIHLFVRNHCIHFTFPCLSLHYQVPFRNIGKREILFLHGINGCFLKSIILDDSLSKIFITFAVHGSLG